VTEAFARYRGAFGPVGIAVQAGWVGSGKVDDSTYVAPGATARQQYQGINLGDGGIQVTYGGLAIGGHETFGRANNGFALDPKGGKNYQAYLVGASYAFGPLIVGASEYMFQNQGVKTISTSPFVGTHLRPRNEHLPVLPLRAEA
jgi:hypothetical protein